MTDDREDGLVELANAGTPADQGLSSLGLVLQLAGTLFAAGAVVLAFTQMIELRGHGSDMLFVFFVTSISCVRSLFHRMAGTELLYGRRALGVTVDTPQDYLAGVRRYIAVGFIHTAVIAVALLLKGSDARHLLGIVTGLALWPAALFALLASPRFRRFRREMPITEDKGFEGAAILMAVLGAMGLFFSGLFLIALLQSGQSLQQGPGVLLILAVVMLVIRSFIHLQAGISGIRETSVDRAVELANRYANFGVISSFCAGGALLLLAMATALSVLVLSNVCALVWILMTWPLIVRRFFSDRQFADLLAGDGAPIHRRAPDAGLTSLGWILIAISAGFLSDQLAEMISGDSLRFLDYLNFSVGDRSPWWTVGFFTLQAWAGIELIRMTSVHRVLGTVYAVAGSAVVIYVMWPLLSVVWQAHHELSPATITLILGKVALELTLPITTLLLVNRKLAPTARARYRPAKQ